MKSRRYKLVVEIPTNSDESSIDTQDNKMKTIKKWMRWNTAPKPIKYVIIFIALYLFLTQALWRGVVREFFLLNLSSSEQWLHIKRHFHLTHDMFEPIFFSEMNYFENSSIAIVGMIRNHDHTIEALLKQLDNLSCLFSLSAVLIYESNSNDNTPKLLNEWSLRDNTNNELCYKYNKDDTNRINTPIIIKKLLNPDSDPGYKYMNESNSRLDKYTEYRNYLLNETIKLNINFDYFVPIDLDIYGFDIKRVLNELNHAKKLNISVMCLNGVRRSGYLYDSLAAIAINNDNDNIDNDNNDNDNMSVDMDSMDSTWLYYMDEVERSNIIYKQQFTEMISCFGAMAFYNFHDIIDTQCRYIISDIAINTFPSLERYYYINPRKNDMGICEHISFNYCLYHHNLKLVIAKNAYLYYGFSH